MTSSTEKVKDDFDRLAGFESDSRWTHNRHYHPFILEEIQFPAEKILEVGCGAGAFCRLVSTRAKEVTGIDLSAKMIAKAEDLSQNLNNISYLANDYFGLEFPAGHFEYIVSIATAHHFSLADFMCKARRELKPGGKLIVLDLYELETFGEKLSELIAVPLSGLLKFRHNGSPFDRAEEQKAWEAHFATDEYLTINEIREIANIELGKAKIQRHLFWRYSLVWKKPL